MSARQAYFTPATFEFLRRLKKNNNRDWFLKNKALYEAEVREPALRFITDIGPALKKISPHLLAEAKHVGGSLFRINRDIRFAADKSPYKTNIGIGFGHDHGRERTAPGFYLHIAPGESFGGGGIHVPDTASLNRVRDAIVKDVGGWKTATATAEKASLSLGGEQLKRPPQGYDANHPLIEDLKRKSFFISAQYSESEVWAPDFMNQYIAGLRAAAPAVRFLAAALGAPW